VVMASQEALRRHLPESRGVLNVEKHKGALRMPYEVLT